MAKERNRYLAILIIVLPFLLVAGFYMFRKQPKEGKLQESLPTSSSPLGLGEYIYMDRMGVLHTKNGCTSVFKDRGAKPVHPVIVSDVSRSNIASICSQCVTEEQYSLLKALAESNEIDEENNTDE